MLMAPVSCTAIEPHGPPSFETWNSTCTGWPLNEATPRITAADPAGFGVTETTVPLMPNDGRPGPQVNTMNWPVAAVLLNCAETDMFMLDTPSSARIPDFAAT